MQFAKTLVSALAVAAVGGFASLNSAEAASVGYEIFLDGVSVASQTGLPLLGGTVYEADGNVVSLSWVTDPDPTIDMGATVIDAGAPNAFSLWVTLTFDPIEGPMQYFLSGSASLTDGTPANTVSIAPSSYDGVFTLLKDQEVIASIGGAAGPFGPGGSFVYGPFTAGGVDCDGVSCTSMTLIFDFLGTGGGDVYGLTGKAINKTPVPVPAALPLMASAIAAVGLFGLRRKS
ncbi:MAG: hypothetical protein MUE49_10445 [Rhodospirillales bacterium]|jgi:hypothetical protein|nr:hypothetical protein [Rhodospirillales bacterium]